MSLPSRRQLEGAADRDRDNLYDTLAGAAAAGDAEAAADLAWAVKRFRLARPALHTYLFKEQDLDIAEQRTMVAVALRIDSFRSDAKFTTWLHRVALNEAKQFIRGESRRGKLFDQQPAEEFADHFIARVSSMIVDRQQIEVAIAALQENHRSALLLREQQGLTYIEIGEQLEIPDSTAKTWVRRGRIQLAELLSPTPSPGGAA